MSHEDATFNAQQFARWLRGRVPGLHVEIVVLFLEALVRTTVSQLLDVTPDLETLSNVGFTSTPPGDVPPGMTDAFLETLPGWSDQHVEYQHMAYVKLLGLVVEACQEYMSKIAEGRARGLPITPLGHARAFIDAFLRTTSPVIGTNGPRFLWAQLPVLTAYLAARGPLPPTGLTPKTAMAFARWLARRASGLDVQTVAPLLEPIAVSLAANLMEKAPELHDLQEVKIIGTAPGEEPPGLEDLLETVPGWFEKSPQYRDDLYVTTLALLVETCERYVNLCKTQCPQGAGHPPDAVRLARGGLFVKAFFKTMPSVLNMNRYKFIWSVLPALATFRANPVGLQAQRSPRGNASDRRPHG